MTIQPGKPIRLLAHTPYLPPAPKGRVMLPYSAAQLDLSVALAYVDRYRRLGSAHAIAVARSARSYANALWVAESDPELSWLELISAVESAASVEDEAVMGTHSERLAEGLPGLASLLEQAGGAVLLEKAAKILAHLTRSGKRFRTFLLDRLPGPRDERPAAGRVLWDTSHITPMLITIYDLRSKRLHEGLPLPDPMCTAPFLDSNGAWWETPIGPSAVGTNVWTLGDAPILLHTFEYMVGEALRIWWLSLPAESQGPVSDPPDGQTAQTA